MPQRRLRNRGSFASHFDELIVLFPDREPLGTAKRRSTDRSPELQEKLDIHALLFERAWKVEE